MPFTLFDPPDYVLDQVFGYQSVNALFDNDSGLKSIIEAEHEFSTGIHTTPRVAWVEGYVDYSAGYSLSRGTYISSVDQSGLGTGQCRVNFAVTFADQNFVCIPGVQTSQLAINWAYDGSSVTSVIIEMADDTGTMTNEAFGLAVFGVAQVT